jgi:hypothetical protein
VQETRIDVIPSASGVLKYFVPLIVLLSLTGCFQSKAPLIDAANAKFPFASMTLMNDDGQILTLKRDGDVYHRIEDGEPDDAELLFHELGPDLYLVQSAGSAQKPEHFEYMFVRKQDGDLVARSDCKGLDPDMLRSKGIEIQGTGSLRTEVTICVFETLQSLVDLGKSPGIWANSTTTLKIVSIE